MSHKSCRWSGGGEGRWAGGGPGSVCFLQRPEGELQSSPSWPLHHPSDTDRLHHPHSLPHTPSPHQHLSSPLLAFPRSPSSLTWSSSALLLRPLHSPCFFLLSFALFLLLHSLYLALYVISANQISALWPFNNVWALFSTVQPIFYFFLSFLLALPFLLLSPGIMQEGHLNPQHSLNILRSETLHILPALMPSFLLSFHFPPPSTLNLSLILELINSAQGHDEAARTLFQYWFLFSPSLSLDITLSSRLLWFYWLPS